MTHTGIALIPRTVEAGEEMEALKRFHRDVTWQGRIEEGGMGPGTPAQTATGKAVHHWIQDGRWVVGEFEQDQFLEDGTFILKWELHWVCGWDPFNREYRATVADCYGHTEITATPRSCGAGSTATSWSSSPCVTPRRCSR